MAESNPPAEVRIHGQKVLGTFSTDADRGYCNDDRNRRFFLEPDYKVDFDYTKGFEEHVALGEDPKVTSLTNVLCWMRDHRRLLIESGILNTTSSRLNVDFVGRRGLFRNLLEAGGDKDLDIQLLVTLYQGTYFISGIWKNDRTQNRYQQMVAASPKLFRQFITSKDGCTPDTPTPADENASFYAMMSANCGRHRLLFSSEVQAERKDGFTPPQRNYLNIRTIPKGPKNIYPAVYHLELEPVEGCWELEHRLSSRRFVSLGKRADDFTFLDESLLHDILDSK